MTEREAELLRELMTITNVVNITIGWSPHKPAGEYNYRIAWNAAYRNEKSWLSEVSVPRTTEGDSLEDALTAALAKNVEVEKDIVRTIVSRKQP